MVTTSNAAYARKIRMLRDWGAEKKYQHVLKGYNFRLEGMQGAVLRVKLRHLEAWTEAADRGRNAMIACWRQWRADPEALPHNRHVYHVYAIRTPRRQAVAGGALAAQGIQTGIHYPIPVHLLPAHADLGYGRGQFPQAERLPTRCSRCRCWVSPATEGSTGVLSGTGARFALSRKWIGKGGLVHQQAQNALAPDVLLDEQPANMPGVRGARGIAQERQHPTSQTVQERRVLVRSEFLWQLRMEKQRADRSRSPLSVLILRRDATDSNASFRDLSGHILNVTREMDVLGYLEEAQYALLLPHTGEDGAAVVHDNVKRRCASLNLTLRVATYPDQIFEDLVVEQAVGSGSQPLLLDGPTEHGSVQRFLKRCFDVFGSFALLLLASPLLLITALSIALTSPGPVIFKQVRLGKRGKPFVFYKFRSMYSKSDDRTHREYVGKLIEGKLTEVNQGDSNSPYYKMKSDPRVTRIGRFIRATSVDELPQLFNVLKGEMSLVGPRPPLPYEVEKYRSWHLGRVLDIKPGITGLWQVEGRSKVSFDDMVRLDLRYQREWSLFLDLKILVKTVGVVLTQKGGD
jgi:lipopolysaccharide/colanic/teichoic acid biosynthesis glycosyltransferase